MNGYKINDNLYINCNNVDYVSFLNDKVKIHMNDNTSCYITQEQYKDIEDKIPQSGGGGGGSVEEATGPVNTETIQTLEAVPENPTSESFSLIRVNGVIYVLTNEEEGI